MSNSAVIILSGGMDSTTLAYWLANRLPDRVIALSFDYGQRHKRELDCAAITADALGFEHHVIPLAIGKLLKGSSLTDPTMNTPHGHYAAENMKQTVVPSRNAIMLAIAHGVAASHGIEQVLIGAHAGDHTIYPDCRDPFFKALQFALNEGGLWHKPVKIVAPFQELDKGDIALLGDALGVDWAATHTCYEGIYPPCGKCGACQERAEAFARVGVIDTLLPRGEDGDE